MFVYHLVKWFSGLYDTVQQEKLLFITRNFNELISLCPFGMCFSWSSGLTMDSDGLESGQILGEYISHMMSQSDSIV